MTAPQPEMDTPTAMAMVAAITSIPLGDLEGIIVIGIPAGSREPEVRSNALDAADVLTALRHITDSLEDGAYEVHS